MGLQKQIQSEHTDKITQSWPRVPGDLRFSSVFPAFLVFFLWFSLVFEPLSILFSDLMAVFVLYSDFEVWKLKSIRPRPPEGDPRS